MHSLSPSPRHVAPAQVPPLASLCVQSQRRFRVVSSKRIIEEALKVVIGAACWPLIPAQKSARKSSPKYRNPGKPSPLCTHIRCNGVEKRRKRLNNLKGCCISPTAELSRPCSTLATAVCKNLQYKNMVASEAYLR